MKPFCAFVSLLLGSAACRAADPAFAFSYFMGDGKDGLHFALSQDGLKWSALNGGKTFLRPTIGDKIMRDPSVCRGPDGTFHLVWTTSWTNRGIGVAHSADLVKWSEQTFLPVMENEPAAANCWAPEIFFDEATKEFLIFWATTIPGRFPETDASGDQSKSGALNHRIYAVTTKDFKDYSKAKLFYDDGFSVIDAFMVKDGARHVLVMKDETKNPQPKKNLRVGFSDKAAGPFGPATEPFSPDWVEGPTLIKVGDAWVVYFDEYTRHRYGAMRTKDFKTWENISGQIEMPKGIRHGTAFSVPAEVAQKLANAKVEL